MPQTAPASPSSNASSFAGILAAFASPAPKRETPWDEEYSEDVAPLSYERALRTHGRYHALDPAPPLAVPPSAANQIRIVEVDPDETIEEIDEPIPMPLATPKPAVGAEPHGPVEVSVAEDLAGESGHSFKRASITIRMSKEESSQLRKRAAAAGMTVSAYLRLCTFEAESLRDLVKQTMAELRVATSPAKAPQAQNGSQHCGWRHWFAWLFPRRAVASPTVRA